MDEEVKVFVKIQKKNRRGRVVGRVRGSEQRIEVFVKIQKKYLSKLLSIQHEPRYVLQLAQLDCLSRMRKRGLFCLFFISIHNDQLLFFSLLINA